MGNELAGLWAPDPWLGPADPAGAGAGAVVLLVLAVAAWPSTCRWAWCPGVGSVCWEKARPSSPRRWFGVSQRCAPERGEVVLSFSNEFSYFTDKGVITDLHRTICGQACEGRRQR